MRYIWIIERRNGDYWEPNSYSGIDQQLKTLASLTKKGCLIELKGWERIKPKEKFRAAKYEYVVVKR